MSMDYKSIFVMGFAAFSTASSIFINIDWLLSLG